MFLVERAQPNFRRLFVVSCEHGLTDVMMDNYPQLDRGRGNEVFGRLIDDHRASILKLTDEVCECQVRRAS